MEAKYSLLTLGTIGRSIRRTHRAQYTGPRSKGLYAKPVRHCRSPLSTPFLTSKSMRPRAPTADAERVSCEHIKVAVGGDGGQGRRISARLREALRETRRCGQNVFGSRSG